MSTQMKKKKTSVQESFIGFVAVKDTTGQGLAEKLIEVIENDFGLEKDSERHPSFNPGEKKSRGNIHSLLQPQPQSYFM